MKVRNIIGEITEFGHSSIWSEDLIEIISITNDTKYLWCWDNQLTSLPELPINLEELYCQKNKIKQLPDLRKCKNLDIVFCDMCCFEPYMLEMKNTKFQFYC